MRHMRDERDRLQRQIAIKDETITLLMRAIRRNNDTEDHWEEIEDGLPVAAAIDLLYCVTHIC